MRRFVYILFCFLALISCQKEKDLSQSQASKFVKLFGGLGSDVGNSVAQFADGSYVVVGTQFSAQSNFDMTIIHTDKIGNLLWQKNLGADFSDNGVCVAVSDENFYAAGTFTSQDSKNIGVVKMSKSGEILWQKDFVTSTIDSCHSMCLTPDGGVAIVGSSTIVNELQDSIDIFVAKLSPEGDSLWAKTYGSDLNDVGIDIAATKNGNLLVVGNTEGFGTNLNTEIILFEITNRGSIVSMNTLSQKMSMSACAIKITSDEKLIIIGNISGQNLTSNLYLSYMENIFNPIWTKIYSGTTNTISGNNLTIQNNNIYVVGEIKNGTSSNACLVNFDISGNMIFEKNYGSEGSEQFQSVCSTIDNGLVMVGSSEFGTNAMISLVKISNDD